MKKNNKVHSKVIKKYSNSVGPKEWDRSLWVAEVLRLASFKYNLEPKDIKKYAKNLRRK